MTKPTRKWHVSEFLTRFGRGAFWWPLSWHVLEGVLFGDPLHWHVLEGVLFGDPREMPVTREWHGMTRSKGLFFHQKLIRCRFVSSWLSHEAKELCSSYKLQLVGGRKQSIVWEEWRIYYRLVIRSYAICILKTNSKDFNSFPNFPSVIFKQIKIVENTPTQADEQSVWSRWWRKQNWHKSFCDTLSWPTSGTTFIPLKHQLDRNVIASTILRYLLQLLIFFP